MILKSLANEDKLKFKATYKKFHNFISNIGKRTNKYETMELSKILELAIQEATNIL